MHELSTQVAGLVRERKERGLSLHELAQLHDVSVEALERVERQGTDAPLADVCRYATALGFDAGLAVLAGEVQHRKPHQRCATCGGGDTFHPQHHHEHLGRCVDAGLREIIGAFASCGIAIVGGCQGFTDGRRGGQARLELPTLADARALLALVDRAPGELPARAGLRGPHPGQKSWSTNVRWDVLPGDLLADATCIIHLAPDDLAPLADVGRNPPPSGLLSRSAARE